MESHKNALTDAEQTLWQQLQHKQLLGIQFNCQESISHFIVDFYCAKAKLVIEINGTQYFDTAHLLKDSIRDQSLRDRGLHVLRFNNRQILRNLDAVVGVIHNVVSERIKSQAPT